MPQRDDILVEPEAPADAERPLRVRVAAFVPLAIALLGIGAILVGGISARHQDTAAGPPVDTIATGSIGAE
jgi:hypothetical protein